MKKISFFPKTFILLNIFPIISLWIYFSTFWSKQIHPFFQLYSLALVFLPIIIFSVYFLWLSHLHEQLIKVKRIKVYFYFLSLFFLTAVYGAGMHLGADQIYIFVKEPVVYFFDEYLSHYLLVFGLLFAGFTMANLQVFAPLNKGLDKLNMNIVAACGIFQGISGALNSIEAQSAAYIVFFLPIQILILYFRLRGKNKNKYPLTKYFQYSYVTNLIVLLIWYVYYQGFPEPTVVGFGRF